MFSVNLFKASKLPVGHMTILANGTTVKKIADGKWVTVNHEQEHKKLNIQLQNAYNNLQKLTMISGAEIHHKNGLMGEVKNCLKSKQILLKNRILKKAEKYLENKAKKLYNKSKSTIH